MTLWHPDPPQGFSTEQGLIIIGRPIIPLIGSPQGLGEGGDIPPPVTNVWVDDLGNEFTNEVGTVMVFAP